MSYCGVCMGGWVGGWGGWMTLPRPMAEIFIRTFRAVHAEGVLDRGKVVQMMYVSSLSTPPTHLSTYSGWVGGWRRRRGFECGAVGFVWVGGWVIRSSLFSFFSTHPPTHPLSHHPQQLILTTVSSFSFSSTHPPTHPPTSL